MLPDSNVNEPASHGFVKFRIKQFPDNPVGTEIFNQAAIYFDFNPPIYTNETVHRIGEKFVEVLVVSLQDPNLDEADLKVYPNPMENAAFFEWGGEPLNEAVFQVFDGLGRQVHFQLVSGNQWQLNRTALSSGMYYFTLEDLGRQLFRGRLIVK